MANTMNSYSSIDRAPDQIERGCGLADRKWNFAFRPKSFA